MTALIDENKQDANTVQEKIDTSQQTPVVSKEQETKTVAPETEQKEDPNWRAFREARKKDRIEREAAEKRAQEKAAEAEALKAAMEAILNKGQQPQQQYASYQEEETEEQRIEKKVQAALEKREMALEQQRHQREQQEFPQRLRQAYVDFDQTISQENLDYLDYHYPEVSRPFQRLPDDFNKWSDIYKAVKKFVPNTNAKKDAARAEVNQNKPKSISSTGLTQAGEGIGSARLSDERKAANWERMQRQLKGLS